MKLKFEIKKTNKDIFLKLWHGLIQINKFSKTSNFTFEKNF